MKGAATRIVKQQIVQSIHSHTGKEGGAEDDTLHAPLPNKMASQAGVANTVAETYEWWT